MTERAPPEPPCRPPRPTAPPPPAPAAAPTPVQAGSHALVCADHGAPVPRGRIGSRVGTARCEIAGALVLIVVLIFIIENAHAVTITFFGAHLRISLAVALLLAAIAGALHGRRRNGADHPAANDHAPQPTRAPGREVGIRETSTLGSTGSAVLLAAYRVVERTL